MLQYPVQYGDVWAAGHHVFLCGDVERDDLLTLTALLPTTPLFAYSIPPWGNMKYWETKNGESVDPEVFWSRYCAGVSSSETRCMFVEQGLDEYEPLLKHAQRMGWPPLRDQWEVRYGSKKQPRPNQLFMFSDYRVRSCNPHGLSGEEMTRHIFSEVADAGDIVLDPCIGLGMTARIAHEFGMRCWGMEISPSRLSRTLEWLEQSGYPIERIAQL